MYSCQNEDDFHDENGEQPNNFLVSNNDIVLGKKLQNPYSVSTMKKALSNLKTASIKAASTTSGSVKATMSNDFEIDIEPTHLYVKFIPKNEEELSIIQSDSTLILYSYPLDYEITEGSGDYRDPDVPEGQPTYQYCAVKVDKQLPTEVESEILEELFIPDEDDDEELASSTNEKISSLGLGTDYDSIDTLVDEALRITNNLDKIEEGVEDTTEEESEIQSRWFFKRRSKWRPAGTIKVWDDDVVTTSRRRVFSHWEYYDCGGGIGRPGYDLKSLSEQCRRAIYKYETIKSNGGYVPVEGVRVRARRWFTTHTGISNAQGRFSCSGRFRRPANYFIKWKRDDFTIRWSWLSAAKYRGPKKTGDWNLNIKGGTQEFYATIFRAAHHYYYKDVKGLKRPPQNYSWKTKIKIRAKYKSKDVNGQHCKDCRWFGVFSRIYIYNPQKNTSDIYATTIHELAHASHWELRRGKWNDNNLPIKVKESWARGVQWELTRMVYPDYRGGVTVPNYTQVVVDMIDAVAPLDKFDNPININNGSEKLFQDNVHGYTIKQIEDVLPDTSSWNEWKNNLKNKYENDTEENLDALFAHWGN